MSLPLLLFFCLLENVLDTFPSADVATPVATATGIKSSIAAVALANDNVFTFTDFQINGTVLVEDTDFTLNKNLGTFKILNSSTTQSINFTVNPVNVSVWNYTFGDNFVQDSTSRVFLGLIPLFFVIGFLLFIIGIIFFKDDILGALGRK